MVIAHYFCIGFADFCNPDMVLWDMVLYIYIQNNVKRSKHLVHTFLSCFLDYARISLHSSSIKKVTTVLTQAYVLLLHICCRKKKEYKFLDCNKDY